MHDATIHVFENVVYAGAVENGGPRKLLDFVKTLNELPVQILAQRGVSACSQVQNPIRRTRLTPVQNATSRRLEVDNVVSRTVMEPIRSEQEMNGIMETQPNPDKPTQPRLDEPDPKPPPPLEPPPTPPRPIDPKPPRTS